MEIDGQCHCGRVTYRADIDPAKVSICHCTDCQNLTGSPYRVTVLCSAAQIRMTGEITLRGRVLPIGGLKEKLLAAARGGIKTVLIPEDNAKDLTEISDAIKGGMEIIPVARLDDVVSRALVRAPVPIVWEEDTKVPVKPEAGDEAAGGLTAH